MNCIFLLLLLGCCGGWGNDRGCGNGCGCGNGRGCCGRPEQGRGGRHEHRHDCHEKERPRCEPCNDGCAARPAPEPCGCAREERECGCDAPSSGIIPPPWQDYPRFPRRDNGEDCGCEQ